MELGITDIALKADRLHLHNNGHTMHTPVDYRHTDKNPKTGNDPLLFTRTETHTKGWTDGRTLSTLPFLKHASGMIGLFTFTSLCIMCALYNDHHASFVAVM